MPAIPLCNRGTSQTSVLIYNRPSPGVSGPTRQEVSFGGCSKPGLSPPRSREVALWCHMETENSAPIVTHHVLVNIRTRIGWTVLGFLSPSVHRLFCGIYLYIQSSLGLLEFMAVLVNIRAELSFSSFKIWQTEKEQMGCIQQVTIYYYVTVCPAVFQILGLHIM